MTVLAKYQRLEAEGLWRGDQNSQRRDVIVAIGDATLTMSALNGEVLAHWSLPATVRLNAARLPAVYAPGNDAPETLEIADPEMVAAIDTVLTAIQTGASRPTRVKGTAALAIAAAFLALVFFWAPGAIARYAASLVPDAARAEIGTRLLEEVERVTGTPCDEPSGLRSVDKLEARLFPDGGIEIAVVPSALSGTLHLPGGLMLASHTLVEDYETPAVLAGFVLAEDVRRGTRDPLERVLADAGLRATLGLLTSGRLPDAALARHAERLVAAPPAAVGHASLLQRMRKAKVDTAPYAYALDISGESTLPLVEASQRGAVSAPLMGDGDWIALQGICES